MSPSNPKNISDIPSVPVGSRGSLWNYVYAAAFVDEYRALMYANEKRGYTADTFVERNALSTAETAKTMADLAVWALSQLEQKEDSEPSDKSKDETQSPI
jgi:hypothetical protein